MKNIQKFAWNSSLLSDSKEDEDFNELIEALMESSSLEEFKIRRDLLGYADADSPQ